MNTFKMNVISEGLTKNEQDLIKKASDHAELAINSEQFKEWCLNFSWQQQVCTGKLWWKTCTQEVRRYFHYNKNLTNFQIYNSIIDGKEVLGDGEIDNEADIFLKVDRRYSRNVIGYTYSNTPWQWVYARILNSWGPVDIASNLIHEYCHKLGYEHEYRYTNAREYSVPYAVGYFVQKYKAK